MHTEAAKSRGIFKVEPSGTDGYVYLGHFSAQTNHVPEIKDCSGKLNGVQLIRSQDISEVPEPSTETPAGG